MSEYWNLEERNYANDHRIQARDAHRWYSEVDDAKMVALVPTEYPNAVKAYARFEYKVCETCNGKGSHVNPSIDASGITADDMYDMDMEAYMDGDYDVECYGCFGKRVVPHQVGETWTEQNNEMAIDIAFGLARILIYRFDLPVPPCKYGHNNCSADGLHGGTCWDETYQGMKADGLIDPQTDSVWIPEGMKINVHTLHAVIANLCSEHEDTGEELTVEMEEAMDVSDPDNLSASEDLHTYINEQRPIVREALRRFRQNSQ
jgi:hypothetical protein